MGPHRKTLSAAALVALIALAASGERAEATIRGSYHVRFEAESTLHDFSGEAPPIAFAVEESAERLAGHEPWSIVLAVDVTSLSTDLALRDDKMRSMLEARRHPRISATIGAVAVERLASGGELPFDLRIRDVTRRVTGRIARWEASPGTASFDVEFDVSLADFALEAPRVMFVKVADHVHVIVTVEARLEPVDPR